MKFEYGDKVVYDDGFASYHGHVVARYKRRNFPFFWKKDTYYEVAFYAVNDTDYIEGNALFKPHLLIPEGEYKALKKQRKKAKITPLKRV